MIEINVEIPISLDEIGKQVTITEDKVINTLYDICDREHACCNNSCPVYNVNNGIPNNNNSRYGCDCFKSGSSMLKFLKENK